MKRLTTNDTNHILALLNMFYAEDNEVMVRGGGPEPDYPCSPACPLFGDCVVAFQNEQKKWVQTNADRIRAMSDKELARFLAEVENRRSAAGGGAIWNGMAHALEWLQQPPEEG